MREDFLKSYNYLSHSPRRGDKAPWRHPAGRRSVWAASATSQQAAGDRLTGCGPQMSGRWARGQKLAARRAALLPCTLPSGEAGWAFREVSNSPSARELCIVSGDDKSVGRVEELSTPACFVFVDHHFLMLSISLNQSSHFCFEPLESPLSPSVHSKYTAKCRLSQHFCQRLAAEASFNCAVTADKTSAVSFGWWW